VLHVRIKCASTGNAEDVEQNIKFRPALQARLSFGNLDEDSASNLSVIEDHNEKRPLSRPVILKRGVHCAEVLPMYQRASNAKYEDAKEHPDTCPESTYPDRLDPWGFPFYMLACDHIVCRACLLYSFNWRYQNVICPMCKHELVRTERFYYEYMMVGTSTVLALPGEDSSLDDDLFHNAMEVCIAFVRANDKPSVVLTTWTCELFAHMVSEHITVQYQEYGSIHSSDEMAKEVLSQSVEYSSIKHVLEVASETLHLVFQKLLQLHARDVPCTVLITGLKAIMLRHIRKAVEEPIVAFVVNCSHRSLFKPVSTLTVIQRRYSRLRQAVMGLRWENCGGCARCLLSIRLLG